MGRALNMIDISAISPTTLQSRGAYSTVRGAHEDAKKELQILCGKLSATSVQVLRKMQPDNDDALDNAAIADLLAVCRWTVDEIEKTAALIDSLARQRADLKPLAWPKP